MANENRYYKIPFAESGDKTEIPDISVAGEVGYDTGYGSNYELPQGNPSRKRIGRDTYNGMFNSMTKNLKQWQEKNYPTWIEDDGTGSAFAYNSGVIVNHNGENWVSNEDANKEEPGVGVKWIAHSDSTVNPYTMTLAEAIANPYAREGDYKEISDRANGKFQYVTGEVNNQLDIIDTDIPNVQLKLIDYNEIDIEFLGSKPDGTGDALPAILKAFELNAGRQVKATGRFACSGPFEIPEGTELKGAGIQDIFRYLSGFFSGTVFLVDSTTFCVKPAINAADFTKRGSMKNLAIFNTNAANTEGVFSDNGVLFFDAEDILISSTVEIEGVGIQRIPSDFTTATNGGHYKYWRNVSVDGGTVKTALSDTSIVGYEGANSTIMYGGRLVGWYKAYERSTTESTGANNIYFSGTSFEGSFDERQDIKFIDGTTNTETIVGVYGLNRYVVKYVDCQSGTYGAFSGCRFEMGGFPPTFDDTVNGVAPIVGSVYIDSDADFASFNGCGWFSMLLVDASGLAYCDRATNGLYYNAGKNTPYSETTKTGSQSIPNEVNTNVNWNFPSILRAMTFESSQKYRVFEAGVYDVAASGICTGTAASTYVRMTILVNNAAVASGRYEQFVNIGGGVYRSIPTITVPVELAAGDDVAIQLFQLSGVAITLEDFASSTFFKVKKIQ